MRKGRRWIDGGILWAWFVMLALADWRSTAAVAAAFAALVLWEKARDLTTGERPERNRRRFYSIRVARRS